jgi:uncharacterized protein (DUF1501 family)
MNRRQFLGYTALAPLMLAAPRLVFAATPAAAAKTAQPMRTLVLVELAGGNDSLNMVVPYADPRYYAARPSIAIARDKVLQLDPRFGLHPALEPMMAMWRAGDMAVALGVGYDRPNRSHFRSIDIWDTASDSSQYLDDGWIARLFAAPQPARSPVADAIVLGGGSRAVSGKGIRAVVLTDPEQFARASRMVHGAEVATPNPALAHILQVRDDIEKAGTTLRRVEENAPQLGVAFPKHKLGKEMESAAKLIASGTHVPVVKVGLSGFDTHSNQPARQMQLYAHVAESLVAFRAAMVKAGAWDRVMVMTYSEFGRRVPQNASNGTDHGTAASHFVLGGKVRGGFIGAAPSLDNLDSGDLRFTQDFRSLYATASQTWLQLAGTRDVLGNHRPLDVLRA